VAGASSTVTLTPSVKYFNVNLYVENMSGWQGICTSAPLGTNVVQFATGACYSIGGAIYAPADNMVMSTTSSCPTAVGQVIAWTLTVNGSGTLTANFSANRLPYIKGLTQ
jgi:hypothetical protein